MSRVRSAFWVRLLFVWPALSVVHTIKFSVLLPWWILKAGWTLYVTWPALGARKLAGWLERKYGKAVHSG
jgi:hypothetical protein